jgi:hypothetical protein
MNKGTLIGGFAAGYTLNPSRLDEFHSPSEARQRKAVALGIYPTYIIDMNPIGGERPNDVIALGPTVYPMSSSFFTSPKSATVMAMAGFQAAQGAGTSNPYVCSEQTSPDVKNSGAQVCMDPNTKICYRMHNNRCGKLDNGTQLLAVNQFTGQTSSQPTPVAIGYWIGK